MSFLVNLALGLLFGTGLVVSGMADPAKVLNFLDIFGTWDPSLAFVMGGAVVVAFIGYRLVLRRDAPIIGKTFHLPTRKTLTRALSLVRPSSASAGDFAASALVLRSPQSALVQLARWLSSRP